MINFRILGNNFVDQIKAEEEKPGMEILEQKFEEKCEQIEKNQVN